MEIWLQPGFSLLENYTLPRDAPYSRGRQDMSRVFLNNLTADYADSSGISEVRIFHAERLEVRDSMVLLFSFNYQELMEENIFIKGGDSNV